MRTLFLRWPNRPSGRIPAISSRAGCCFHLGGCKAANIAPFGFTYIRPLASAMTDKNYVVRPWTKEEDADFEQWCARLGETPSDPVHARAMEHGLVDFMNNDPWYDMELPRA